MGSSHFIFILRRISSFPFEVLYHCLSFYLSHFFSFFLIPSRKLLNGNKRKKKKKKTSLKEPRANLAYKRSSKISRKCSVIYLNEI